VTRLTGPGSGHGVTDGAAVYMGGNMRTLVELTQWGSRVLYVGDHVESDMRDPRRFGWRTAMILTETAADVEVQNSEAYRLALCRLLEAKDFLANVYSVRRSADRYAKDATRAQVEGEMEDVRREVRAMFPSPSWGSLFSSDTQSSLFGLRVYVSSTWSGRAFTVGIVDRGGRRAAMLRFAAASHARASSLCHVRRTCRPGSCSDGPTCTRRPSSTSYREYTGAEQDRVRTVVHWMGAPHRSHAKIQQF